MSHTTPPTDQALLEVAERLFARRGYAAVGIREIAEAAGANLASIGYHFGSKRELYLQTVRRVMGRHEGQSAWARLHEVPRGDFEAAVCLGRFVGEYLAMLLREGGEDSCGALMLWEAVRPSEAIDAVVSDYIRPGNEALIAVVQQLLPPPARPRADLYARSILAQVLHYRVFGPFIARLAGEGGASDLDPDIVSAHIVGFSLRAMGRNQAFIDRVLAACAGAESTVT